VLFFFANLATEKSFVNNMNFADIESHPPRVHHGFCHPLQQNASFPLRNFCLRFFLCLSITVLVIGFSRKPPW
jgi:hypothetical protein